MIAYLITASQSVRMCRLVRKCAMHKKARLWQGANADLWKHFWMVNDMRQGGLHPEYFPAHVTEESITKESLLPIHVCGNFVADGLAQRGAATHQVPYDVAVPALWHSPLAL